jgi:hypothetical protein
MEEEVSVGHRRGTGRGCKWTGDGSTEIYRDIAAGRPWGILPYSPAMAGHDNILTAVAALSRASRIPPVGRPGLSRKV